MMMYWRENILLPIRLIERRKMALKKAYEAPMLMVETYMLDTSIAANCTAKLPYADQACYDEYHFSGVEFSAYAKTQKSFDKDTCDCYHTSGGEGYFTS